MFCSLTPDTYDHLSARLTASRSHLSVTLSDDPWEQCHLAPLLLDFLWVSASGRYHKEVRERQTERERTAFLEVPIGPPSQLGLSLGTGSISLPVQAYGW